MSNGQQDQQAIQPADLPEVQGLVLRGYTFELSRHFVLAIEDPDAFKTFLGRLVPGGSSAGPLTVTSAATWPSKPDYALNLGLSYAGIQALRLPVDFGGFLKYQAFKQGAAARAAVVCDVGPSAPSNWVPCLNAANAGSAHVILSLYAQQAAVRESATETLRGMFGQGGAARALPFGNGTDFFDGQALPGARIHFDYEDGISQPAIMGLPRRPDMQPAVPAYEVVLRADPNAPYPFPQPDVFARNGSFSAFRILEQDVAGFDGLLKSSGIDPELLAAKLCGRWRNGNPLELFPGAPGDPLPPDQLSNFDYRGDPDGTRCPIGSHTRRANPRGTESVTNPFPDNRIVRRAMPYGPAWEPGQGKDGIARGLVGHFIGASLENQFEFIMGKWIDGHGFTSNFTQPQGLDPLLGPNDPRTSTFDFPPGGRVTGFEQLIVTRGGLYCLLPSLPSLAWMAAGGA